MQLDDSEIENKQQAYFNLGNTKFNLKDKNGACENWKKALELGADYAKDKIDEYCKEKRNECLTLSKNEFS
ncbi:hypothetical protein [Flavobacterium sp.]|uniref:hypothetical protein n=1 Tax=Flavobacterium sp. TaxID=239 RepID=UPI003D0E9794